MDKIILFINFPLDNFWPIWWLFRKVYSVQIKSEFRMKITTKEWFENNVSYIINNVKLTNNEGGK